MDLKVSRSCWSFTGLCDLAHGLRRDEAIHVTEYQLKIVHITQRVSDASHARVYMSKVGDMDGGEEAGEFLF